MSDEDSDKVRCAHQIDGAKVYRRVVLTRRQCKRMVTPPARYCWQHKARYSWPDKKGTQ